MRAEKGNKVYTITEEEKERYQNDGFDIFYSLRRNYRLWYWKKYSLRGVCSSEKRKMKP